MTPRSIAFTVVACFLSAISGMALGYYLLSSHSTAVAYGDSEPVRLESFAGTAPTAFVDAAEAAVPAVVSLRAYMMDRVVAASSGSSVTTGSAVIISSNGYLATNNHVIEGARRIVVTLPDRREYVAEVIGVDESTDLALLKIDAGNLVAATFGNSDSLRVGEWVLAIGNPYSLKSTVTTGIVSAKGRSIDVLRADDRIESFIQTDAAVNPGNSGGALVNTAGELVGINTAIITNSGRHEGYSFAIPGNLARRVLNDLRDYGEVKRAVLGVWIQGINAAQARRLNLPATSGAVITNLTPEGPAARSGLEIGDVMTAINGREINSSAQMQERLSQYRPGQEVRITYIRNGRTREKTILLRDKRNRSGLLVSETNDDLLHRLGFEVRGLTYAEYDRYPEGGVKVIAIFRDSPIKRTNMKPGFIVTGLNGLPVANLEDLLDRISGQGSLLFKGFYEGHPGEYYYQLPAS